MPDLAIFIFGSLVTVLVSGGLIFTVVEVRRIDSAATRKRDATPGAALSGPME